MTTVLVNQPLALPWSAMEVECNLGVCASKVVELAGEGALFFLQISSPLIFLILHLKISLLDKSLRSVNNMGAR